MFQLIFFNIFNEKIHSITVAPDYSNHRNLSKQIFTFAFLFFPPRNSIDHIQGITLHGTQCHIMPVLEREM